MDKDKPECMNFITRCHKHCLTTLENLYSLYLSNQFQSISPNLNLFTLQDSKGKNKTCFSNSEVDCSKTDFDYECFPKLLDQIFTLWRDNSDSSLNQSNCSWALERFMEVYGSKLGKIPISILHVQDVRFMCPKVMSPLCKDVW